jgi:hypothetical protein
VLPSTNKYASRHSEDVPETTFLGKLRGPNPLRLAQGLTDKESAGFFWAEFIERWTTLYNDRFGLITVYQCIPDSLQLVQNVCP